MTNEFLINMNWKRILKILQKLFWQSKVVQEFFYEIAGKYAIKNSFHSNDDRLEWNLFSLKDAISNYDERIWQMTVFTSRECESYFEIQNDLHGRIKTHFFFLCRLQYSWNNFSWCKNIIFRLMWRFSVSNK